MGRSKPRRASLPRKEAILFKLQMTRWRQKAWRERPDHMEAIRKKATDRAKTVKDEKNQRLTMAIQALPDSMTTKELDDLFLAAYLEHKQVTRDSFHKRVKRRGLLAYDPAKGLWLNLSKISPYAG